MTKTPQQLAKIAVQARKNFAAGQQKIATDFVPVGHFSEHLIPTCIGETRVFTYISCEQNEPVPVFVNLHGGGFMMGSAEDDDIWCRRLVSAVPCLVVNIDYRLAPEHKFPIALEESYAVVKYLHDNAPALRINPQRIAVGGQSAGGNLAAGLCLLARSRQEFSFCYQVLNYPALDMSVDPFSQPADKILTPRLRALFNDCYLRTKDDALNPLVSPLLAENLASLPAALVITAELDPLRPEAEQYAKRLTDAGVKTICKMFIGCMHAFTHFGPRPSAEEAERLIHTQLRRAFED
ncbi:MAG: esterase [Anaerosporomusa subterranea]|jgi:acetyl esterase|nr:esterase [Anaerosporomusa subterranea]